MASQAVVVSEHETGFSRVAVIAIVLLALVYIASAFSPALLDDADSTHAEAAREMAATGDFVTLKVNGVRYLEKAPLMYWAVALCYRVFGVNEFATRLPLLLATLAVALLAFRWGRHAFGDRAGLYASLFVSSCAGFYLFTRILIPEAILTLWIALGLCCFLSALEQSGKAARWWWYGVYASAALGVLTKGLVAPVFIAGPAFLYLLITGEWRRWREFRIFGGTLVLLAIAAPWHILAGVRNEGFFWFYFVNEHFLRFLGRRYPKDYNKLPAIAYWTMHLVWLFPWSVFLWSLVSRTRSWFPESCQRLRDQRLTPADRLRLLCWLWAGFILLFFAFSTNQEYYTFPVYFPFALLIADAVAHTEREDRRRQLLPAHAVLVAVGIACAGALFSGLWSARNLPFVDDIGTVLARRGVGDYTLSMSHFFDLTGAAFAALRLPAALAAIAFAIGPVVALVLRRKGRHSQSTLVIAATMATFLFAAHVALERFEPFLSSKPLANVLRPQLKDADRVFIYGDQAWGSSLLFYLQRPIYLVNGRSTSMEFGSKFPDAPRIFLDDSQFLEVWNSDATAYLFVPRERREQVTALLGDSAMLVKESSGKAIYTNRTTALSARP